MDLDQTQAIVLEDFNEDTDEETEDEEKKPVSYLKVVCQKGFPETKFPLYEGDNVIGRQQDICNIYIPIKALSKQHACIEVRGESHLIYDKGSRNKTKRGKLYLSPDVRYELRDGDVICMADVNCVYQLHSQEKEAEDSGSETGSESMFQTAQVSADTVPDTQEEGRRKFREATHAEINDEDESSNASSDLLQPTQLYGVALGDKARKGRLDEATTLMFAEDSDLSDVETSNNIRKKRNVTVAETPAVVRTASLDTDDEDGKHTEGQTLVFEDEKDESGDKETLLAAPTQAYVMESDVDDEDEKETSDSALLGAATQMYGAVPGEDGGVSIEDSMDGETTADGLTLAYDVTLDEGADIPLSVPSQKSGSGSKVKKTSTQRDEAILPTQAYDLEPEAVTQEFDVGQNSAPKTGNSEDSAGTTQPLEEENDDSETEGDEAFFAAPTMACDLEDFGSNAAEEEAVEDKSESEEKSTISQGQDATQVFETVPISPGSPAKTSKNVSPVKSRTSKTVEQTMVLTSDECADTVAVDNDEGQETENESESDKLKVKLSALTDPTLDLNDGTTQPIEEEEEICDKSHEISKLEDNVTKDDPTQVFVGDDVADEADIVEADAETLMIGAGRTLSEAETDVPEKAVKPDTVVINTGETQMIVEEDADAAEEGVSLDDATQAIVDLQPEDVAKSGRSTRKAERTEIEATQVYGDETDGEEQKPAKSRRSTRNEIMMEATQAYGDGDSDEDKKPARSRRSTRKGNEILMEATQAYGDDETEAKKKPAKTRRSTRKGAGNEIFTEATQAYGDEETDVKNTTKARQSPRKAEQMLTDATQAYGDEDKDEKKPGKSGRSPRKAYEVVMEATQAYGNEETDEEKTPVKSKQITVTCEDILVEETQGYGEDETDEEIKADVLKQSTRSEQIFMEATQAYGDEETDEEKKPARSRRSTRKREEILEEATQAYGNEEMEGEKKPVKSRRSPRKGSGSPEDVAGASSEEVVPDSCESEDNTPTAIPLPAFSPHKPTLASPRKAKMPSPKKVMFVGLSEGSSASQEEIKDEVVDEPTGSAGPSESDGLEVPVVSEVNPESVKQETSTRRGRSSRASSLTKASDKTKPKRGRGGRTRQVKAGEPAEDTPTTASSDGGQETVTVPVKPSPAEAAVSPAAEAQSVTVAPPKRRGRGGKRSSNISEVKKSNEEVDTNTEEILGGEDEAAVANNNENQQPGSEQTENTENAPVTRKTIQKERKSRRVMDVLDTTDTHASETKLTDATSEIPVGDLGDDVTAPKITTRGRKPRQSLANTQKSSEADTEEPAALSRRSGRSQLNENGAELVLETKTRASGRKGRNVNVKEENDAGKISSNQKLPTTGRRGKKVEEVSEKSTSNTESKSIPESKTTGLRGRKVVEDSDESVKNASITESKTRGRKGIKVEADSEESPSNMSTTESESLPESKTRGRRGKKVEEGAGESTNNTSTCITEAKTTTRRGKKVEEDVNENVTNTSIAQSKTTGRRGRKVEKDSDESSLNTSVEEFKPVPQRGRKSKAGDPRGDSEAEVSQPVNKGGKASVSEQDIEAAAEEQTPVKRSGRGRASTQSRKSEVLVKPEIPVAEEASAETENPQVLTTPKRGRRKQAQEEPSSMGPPSDPPAQPRGRSKQRQGTTDSAKEVSGGNAETPGKRGRKSTAKSSASEAKQAKLSDSDDQLSADIPSSPSTRRKSMDPKPKVAFTGVVDVHGQKITTDLGGELVSCVHSCTHLVTDQVRRTVKFLCCLARGLPIVVPQWLDRCKDAGLFVDSTPYVIQDKVKEKQYKFSLRTSILRANQTCLLAGYKIHVTKSVLPNPPQMKDIIQCAGAEYLAKLPTKLEDQVVVISCEEDKKACQSAIQAGIPVLSSEFILTGILKQEILIDNYRLFQDPGGRENKRLSTQTGGAAAKKRKK